LVFHIHTELRHTASHTSDLRNYALPQFSYRSCR